MPTDPLCHEKCMNLFLILHLNVLLYGEEFFKDPNMEFNTATFETMEHAWDGIGAWKSVQWQKSFFFQNTIATKLDSLCICKYIDENMTSKSTWPIVNDFSLSIQRIEIGKQGRFSR